MGGRRKEEELSPHLDTVKANGLPGNHGGQHFLVSCQPDSWEHTPRLWPRRAWVDPTYLQIQALPPTRSLTSVFLLPNTGKTDLGEHPRHLQERNRRPLWSPTLSPSPMGSLSQVPTALVHTVSWGDTDPCSLQPTGVAIQENRDDLQLNQVTKLAPGLEATL